MMTFLTDDSSRPCWITLNDFNQDNQLDIVVANSNDNTIRLLFGYGNGSFQKQIKHLIGYNSRPYAIASGDFNKDSRNDIVVANYNKKGVDILLKKCWSNKKKE